ncbi:MAG TPA: FG-GAP-like repeat-containing protein [Candidatus Binatia bacterium]|nr:FG-GAP-like repeat-containing protein [Candidatus Binatia bacterium]
MTNPTLATLVLTGTLTLLVPAARAATRGCLADQGGTPLRRMSVSWSENFSTVSARTDTNGCVTVTATPGWDGRVGVDVHAQNPVVRVLDGGLLNLEVKQGVRFREGETARIADQSVFYTMAEAFRTSYDTGLREFGPWGGAEFPNSTVRTSKNVIAASVHDLSPAAVAWTEPAAVGSDFPLIHYKGDTVDSTVPHELGHALHFGEISLATRQRAETEYLGWLAANLTDPFHCTAKRTNRIVAYIEAFGLFAERYPGTTTVDGATGARRHAHFYDDAENVLQGSLDTNCDGSGDDLHALTGDDVEGAVFGVLFWKFARHPAVGLDYAVSRYVDCQSLTLQEYGTCVRDREGAGSTIFRALIDAAHEFAIDLDVDVPWTTPPQDGDEFGAASARGDFDGDGYTDLAVGAPNAAPPGAPRSGVVYVFKGSASGLWPWHQVRQTGLGMDEAGDRFGAALAVRDLDGDGLADLVVGAPGEAPGSDPKAGAIFLFRGRPTALTTWTAFNQAQLGQTNRDGDRFGSALAIGDVDHDGRLEVAVGAPGKGLGSTPRAGAVFVLHGTAGGLVAWRALDQTGLDTAFAGDDFGATLAIGDLDGDLRGDLVIGAPKNQDGPPICSLQPVYLNGVRIWTTQCSTPPRSGAIFLFRGAATGIVATQVVTQAAFQATGEDGDLFGAALAIGDFDRNGRRDVAVGAPRARQFAASPAGSPLVKAYANGGHVFVLRGGTTLAAWRHLSQAALGGADESGDRFGAALAAADFDGDAITDLAIGAPGEAPGADPQSGFVYVARGTATNLVAWVGLDQRPFTVAAGGNANQAGDRFGETLLTGDFDANTDGLDLVVSAPADAYVVGAPRSGHAYVFAGAPSRMSGLDQANP